MNFKKKRYISSIFLLVSLVLSVVAVMLVAVDSNFEHRWLAFWLHMISLLIICTLACIRNRQDRDSKERLSQKEVALLVLIIVVSLISNFLFLSIYPFVSISDELRDGGLFAFEIAMGTIRNIFEYGSYNAHGLIIPTFSSFFYYFFGSSVLTFRVPAALLSIVDVLLVYVLVRRVLNKETAFWSAVVLVTLPLHMFFARTQLVVAFNFFWVPVILILLHSLLMKGRMLDYVIFGTVLGFASGFHAAIRAFACLVLLLLIFLEIQGIISRKNSIGQEIKKFIGKFIVLICFFIVGFGPRLLFTEPSDFFHTSRLSSQTSNLATSSGVYNEFSKIQSQYMKSLMVFFYEPTIFFFPDHKPVLSPIFAIFFFIGIGSALFVIRNKFLNLLFCILLVLPLFVSAITDYVNADHRLSPLFAITSIFVGIGVTYFIQHITNTYLRFSLRAGILVLLFFQVTKFYGDQPINLNTPMKDYLSMHAIYFLQNQEEFRVSPAIALQQSRANIPQVPICLIVSPANYDYYYGNVGIVEQQKFLLSNALIQYKEQEAVSDNEIYIYHGTCLSRRIDSSAFSTIIIPCNFQNRFFCPIENHGDILIHYLPAVASTDR